MGSLLATPAHTRCRLCRGKGQQAGGNPHPPKRMGRPLKAAASPPKRARQIGANPEAEAEEPEEGLSGGVSKSELDIAVAMIQLTQQHPNPLKAKAFHPLRDALQSVEGAASPGLQTVPPRGTVPLRCDSL